MLSSESEMNRVNSDQDAPALYLVGIRLDRRSERAADLFTIYVDDEQPLAFGRRIIVFPHSRLARAALARCDDPKLKLVSVPTTVHLVYDVPVALDRIVSAAVDPDASILNLLNFLFDVVRVIDPEALERLKPELYPLADHLTFSKDLVAFFATDGGRRQKVAESITFAIGLVARNAFVVSDMEQEHLAPSAE